MTGLEELRREWQGDLGPLLYEELARIVRATTAVYPPAVYSPTGAWAADSWTAVLHDWYVERLRRGDLDAMLKSAYDERALRRQLTTSLRQWLANARRRDSASNLYKRTRDLLRRDDEFASAGGSGHAERFTLTRAPTPAPSDRPPRELLRLAHELSDDDLQVVRYGATSLKSSPILRAPALKRFVEHLLGGAEGSMTVPDINAVQRMRFDLAGVQLSDLHEAIASDAEPVDLEVTDRIAAEAVLAQLDVNAQERVRALERCGDAQSAAAELAVGPEAMQEQISHLVALIAEVASEGQQGAVYDQLIEMLFERNG